VDIGLGDEFKLETDARYLGDSITFEGAAHPAYFLVDQQIRWFPAPDLELRAGVINLFDERAQVVQGFPLPGRLLRASISAGF
jgi:outer membrane receptor protein involved in Fe transport